MKKGLVPVVMTIAGSDSGGGAGIQADLKSFQELGCFGTSVITAVTAQNTLGVTDVYPVSIDTIEAQLDAVLCDLRPVAIKSGMLFSSQIVELVAHKLRTEDLFYVCDPVMVAKGGSKLLQDEAVRSVKEVLLPRCDLVTPNIPEAEILAEMEISSQKDMIAAGERILKAGAKAVLMKGGHLDEWKASDILVTADRCHMLSTEAIATKNTHGTGCTYSAAITAGIGLGKSLLDAVILGKAFVHRAIAGDLHLGEGHGPTNHHAFQAAGGTVDFVKVEVLK